VLRNVGRGARDTAVFESGLVFGAPRPGGPAPVPGVAGRPSDEVLAALDERLPEQTRHVAVALVPRGGEPSGDWWGDERPPAWAEAIEAARHVAAAAGVAVTVTSGQHPPFHPGRCAVLRLGETVIGHAGEVHPRVIASLGLPARTSAMELDLDAVTAVDPGPVVAPTISTFPEATRDVAVVVARDVPVSQVEEALVAGAGPLLESLRLFDVYRGEPVPAGYRSLAFALRFRAPDRTLTDDEVNAARDAALASAAERVGAVLRA
jgi:phenylalanyl-tRNA synthetase beta chain